MDYSVHRYMIHPTSDELQQWWQLKIIVKLDLCGKFRPPGLKLRVNPFGSSTTTGFRAMWSTDLARFGMHGLMVEDDSEADRYHRYIVVSLCVLYHLGKCDRQY